MEKEIVYVVYSLVEDVAVPFHMDKRYEGRTNIVCCGSDLTELLEECKSQLLAGADKWITDHFKNPNLKIAERITDVSNWSDEVEYHMEGSLGASAYLDKGFNILTQRTIGDDLVTYGLKKIEISGETLDSAKWVIRRNE